MCVYVLFFPVRVVIFAIVWLMTWGKLTFWLFPNLTEDVGFFDSFRPVYQCTFASKSEGSEEDVHASGGCGDSSGEPAGGKEEKSEDHVEELEVAGEDGEGDEDLGEREEAGEDDKEEDDDDGENSSDEDDDDADGAEEHSSVGTNDNGYEMVSSEDVENGEHGDEAAEAGEDEEGEESRPTVRRRKGKRRIT